MSQVMVWKCDKSGILFEDKKKYIKHLKKLAKNRILFKRISVIIEECNEIVQSARYVDELNKKMNEAVRHYYKKGYDISGKFKLEFDNLKYSKTVSNSHYCPKNGVTNWSATDITKPTAYPGLFGRLNSNMSDNFDRKISEKRSIKNVYSAYNVSELLGKLGIHTGTGGLFYGWDVRIFQDDFPNLSEMNEHIIRDIIE